MPSGSVIIDAQELRNFVSQLKRANAELTNTSRRLEAHFKSDLPHSARIIRPGRYRRERARSADARNGWGQTIRPIRSNTLRESVDSHPRSASCGIQGRGLSLSKA